MDLRVCFYILIDGLLALAALILAAWVRFGDLVLNTEWQPDQAMMAAALFVAVVLFSSYLMEVYTLPRESRKRDILATCVQAGCAAFFFLSVVYYLSPELMLGQGVLFFALGFFIILQFTWYAISGIGARRVPFAHRVLILGTGDLACQLGGLLSSQSGSFTLAGFLECDERHRPEQTVHQPELFRSQILPKNDDLLQAAREQKASTIVVALTERRGVLPLQEMMRCKLNGIEVLDAPTFYEMVQGKLLLEEMTPSWIIFSRGFHRTALVNVYKRCVDIMFSLIGLLLAAPAFPFIALAVKLDSPGPILFAQERVGLGEKTFTLYKFRSMCQDAERDGAVWAAKNDARITRVGAFLRNSRIDEIPQLFNVLRGEMSFIGPRPERPEFVERLKQEIYYYSKRHTIKPGLTGWAQVRYPYGSTVQDAIEKLRYDLYYIKNLSVFLDTQIIMETVKVVLFGRGR
ncbi:TIGR03013 family PEP-CTERM/XrtA system glycosyltransferase [Geomonas sp. Red69]|uniref:TIGR03013 family XrtA/PEP-CTERM system glycosyltransferase n=1 Tax=Geomonas diazotrophica TaxID=2843197 RepID=UPI001C11D209|nr:TIGR03013 family XrtA/PEP-CTERM system glycosyltransferase [Geomonas diazotrophica]MBU5638134.1 TIGR03013 family PEP-CTERM/XrtA system glycosyltransferase [Geomonas diazotrophica]